MLKSVKSRAEEQFAATRKKDKQALKEKEKARQERAEHTARLRALRLAKEAVDKKAAEKAGRRESGCQEEKAIAFAQDSPTLIVTAAKAATDPKIDVPQSASAGI